LRTACRFDLIDSTTVTNLQTNSAFTRASLGTLLSALVASCTLTPPPQTPGIVEEIQSLESYGGSWRDSAMVTTDSLWWAKVGGDELVELVEVLRQDSLVLTEARLQAQQSQERALQARGSRSPAASASVNAGTMRLPGADGEGMWSEDYATSLNASFDLDVFGKLRASQRAAQLNAMAAALSFQATEQREIAALAKSWVSATTLQRRLELAREIADSFHSTYELTDQRYRAGSTSSTASDVQITLQNLDTALVDIPELATQLQTQLLAIDEQLARMPGETSLAFDDHFQPDYGVAVAIGRPASLLANRPDVAAAELRYRAALEDVGAARASLYPAISLSAALTFQSDSPADMFDWDEYIANLAGALIQPVFQGGRLKSQVRLEQARADELATAFARSTLSAVIDVETSLANLTGLGEQHDRLKEAVASAQISNDIAQTRYRQGLASIFAVLETQRSLNNAQQNLILTEQALLNAQIDLFLSLGGDWSGLPSPGQLNLQPVHDTGNNDVSEHEER
jgi:NodT family efflux transporter outer membrane factor (OMF) lipoprotein